MSQNTYLSSSFWLTAATSLSAAQQALLSEELPMCDLDCTDGALYYRVLVAWRVPWSRVPLESFLRAWLPLPAEDRRRQLLVQQQSGPDDDDAAAAHHYQSELDPLFWCANLLKRDDVRMLAAALPVVLPSGGGVADPPAVELQIARRYIERGSAACLALWADVRGWQDGRWAERHLAAASPDWYCRTAAAGGHLAMLKLLVRRGGCPWTERTAVRAAGGGHLPCLCFLAELEEEEGRAQQQQQQRRGRRVFTTTACDAAAEGGHLACLRFLRSRGARWSARTCDLAAREGRLACLAYLLAHGCPHDGITLDWAAIRGKADSLRMLQQCTPQQQQQQDEIIMPIRDDDACYWAARGGHLECLRAARELGCGGWDARACAAAAGRGHLHCLLYLRRHGCPWDDRTTLAAARAGHLHCFDYARAGGCALDIPACAAAADAFFASRELPHQQQRRRKSV